ncbi:MAG: HDOD domain-containing protein [Gammaproteobacteria bacterium]|nr:HDOD domain-containing protein [Gammaproteobacteria bacterium]
MQDKTRDFLKRVEYAVASEQLLLPSLPDVALRIRSECDQDDASPQKIADIISQDPALAVRLLQVANSSLYRTRQPADSLYTAVTRLGLRMVKDIILTLSLKQLYQAHNKMLQDQLRQLWQISVNTASLSRMLASQIPALQAEQAMLAGLTHNIGALPILLMAEDDEDILGNVQDLLTVMHNLQGELGAYIFKAWHFPEYLIDVARNCYQFSRHHDGQADYLDVVQVALIQGSIYSHLDCPPDWSSIPAFNKLGIDTSTHLLDLEANKIMFDETEALFR